MFNRHLLLAAFAALSVECRQQFGERARHVRSGLTKSLCKFSRLFRDHRAPGALHYRKMHRDRLCGDHAFNLIGRLECPQPSDDHRHSVVFGIWWQILWPPSHGQHRVGDLAVEMTDFRSADAFEDGFDLLGFPRICLGPLRSALGGFCCLRGGLPAHVSPPFPACPSGMRAGRDNVSLCAS